MTERLIDPSNYLDLAGGREDIAVMLMEADRKRTLQAQLFAAIPGATLSTLEDMVRMVEKKDTDASDDDDDEYPENRVQIGES